MALLKLLALPAVAISLVSASPAPEQDMRLFVKYEAVYQVRCLEGSGSAFKVGRHKFISAAHVTAMQGCSVRGVPITVTEQDGAKDFSRFDAAVEGPSIRVSCEGFHAGEWTWAIGHAFGLPVQTAIATYTTYLKAKDGKRVMFGPHTFIPGMSGGAVLNRRGEAIGIVNAYVPGTPVSLSRDLRETSLCA